MSARRVYPAGRRDAAPRARRAAAVAGAALACLSLVLAEPAPAAAEGPAQPPAISVTGHGTARAAPDMARLRVGVETRAATAEAALSENSAATARVIARLKEAGVPPADIATTGLSVYPVQRGHGDGSGAIRLEGFQVVNAVTARLTDLDGLGGLLDRLVREGANRIDGLSFGLSDPAAAEAEARARAVADARAAAETYAGAAGLALGPILSISDRPEIGPLPGRMGVARLEAATVPIEPGSAEVTAQVTVVWELAPAE